ncbi:MAG: RNA-guided pseudouridylation complex pseudouridine synthase subunit Cbf5 [Candidatus Kariarchaeaceae archaeon]|jgi:H/ACA ribonucleoprotein complex subunit 4
MPILPANLTIVDSAGFDAAKSSPYGVDPYHRSISNHLQFGIINLDKQAGPTSHEIVSIIKNILEINKAGHSGTLDPNVTGVLPVALLSATRVLFTLLSAPKMYVCNMKAQSEISRDVWEKLFTEFTGSIYQVPPLKSNVVKKLRKRRIYNLDLLEVQRTHLLFSVRCEAGTYIRTLCEDLGRAAGTRSYMKELRRIQTGPFQENDVVTLHQLFDAYEDYKDGLGEEKLRQVIRPVEEAIPHLPVVVVRENAIDPVCHGSNLAIPGILAFTPFSTDSTVVMLSAKGELIAIGTALKPSQAIDSATMGPIVHPDKVIMPRKTYN